MASVLHLLSLRAGGQQPRKGPEATKRKLRRAARVWSRARVVWARLRGTKPWRTHPKVKPSCGSAVFPGAPWASSPRCAREQPLGCGDRSCAVIPHFPSLTQAGTLQMGWEMQQAPCCNPGSSSHSRECRIAPSQESLPAAVLSRGAFLTNTIQSLFPEFLSCPAACLWRSGVLVVVLTPQLPHSSQDTPPCPSSKLLHMALSSLDIFHLGWKYNLNAVFSLQSVLDILVSNKA